ncbi:MAG: VOC family protein [Proteobacteria bacterium]|nr:VOC family protein [Pseudomonadota bacterium]
MKHKAGIQAIGQLAIAVSNIERSLKFYVETLGLKLLFKVPPGLAFLNCDGVRLMLTTLQGEERDHRTSVIYYKVNDISVAAESIRDNGVTFIREPQLAAKMDDHELWIGFIRDPDENLVGIMAEVPFTDN